MSYATFTTSLYQDMERAGFKQITRCTVRFLKAQFVRWECGQCKTNHGIIVLNMDVSNVIVLELTLGQPIQSYVPRSLWTVWLCNFFFSV